MSVEHIQKQNSILRPPDWRWQEAVAICNADKLGVLVTEPDDPVVLFAVRLQKAAKDPAKRQFIKIKMPDAWTIIQLGSLDSSSQLKAQLQACLVGRLSAQQTSQKLGWPTVTQVKLYRDLFCDLTDVLDITGWFQQMMLQPARKGRSVTLFRARALARYYSVDIAINSLRFGPTSAKAKEAMTKMWKDQKVKRIFDYMSQSLNVPVQVYVNSMQQSIKAFQDREFARQLRGQQQEQTSIADISRAIQQGIRGFTKAQIAQTTEGQQSGIDFTADFIEKLKDKGQQYDGSKVDRQSDAAETD